MNKKSITFNCDICSSNKNKEIQITKRYTTNKPIHVCVNCGFVFVKKRRESSAIAESWSKELFGKDYAAHKPYMRAWHVFLA